MVIRIRRNTKRGTRGELTGQRTHPGRVLPSSCTRFRHASKSRATEFLKFGDCRRCDDEIETRELGFGPTFVVKLPQLRDFFPRFFHSRGPADPAPSLPGFLSIAEPTAAAGDPRNPRSTTSCTSHRPCARHHPRKAPQRTGGTTVTTGTRWATPRKTLSSTRRTGCRRRPPSTRVRSAAPRSARSRGTYRTSWMARVRRRRSLSCRHSRISDTGGETRVLGTRARARGPVRRLYETWRSSSRRSALSSCPRGSSSTIAECRTEVGTARAIGSRRVSRAAGTNGARGHGHQPHSPRAGRRSPGSQPKSRRNNSLGGDGDLVYFESPMPNPERRGGNPSPVARPRGPTPRKMRGGNKSSSFDRAHKGSPERADSVQVRDNLAAALGLTLFSPSPPGDGLPAVRTSFEWGEKDVGKLSASPTANRTLHFATRAPSKAATIHVAKPRPRPLSHAPAVARHLGVLEDDSALASPDSEFSSESGSLGVREGAGEGGGAFRSGFHEAVQPRVGSGSGRGAFRVVGSFTPAPSSAFKAVDKRGSASEVEEASERLRRDRKAGSSGLGGSSGLTQSLRRDAFG